MSRDKRDRLKSPSSETYVEGLLENLGNHATIALAVAFANTEYGGVISGMWYYNTTVNAYMYYDGTDWYFYGPYLGEYANDAAVVAAMGAIGYTIHDGDYYFNTTIDGSKYYNGAVWFFRDKLYATALPVAGADYFGATFFINAGGVRSREYVCHISDAGVYIWTEVSNGGL